MFGREDEIFVDQGPSSRAGAADTSGAFLWGETAREVNGDVDGRPNEVSWPPGLVGGSVEGGKQGAADCSNNCYKDDDLFPHGAGLLPLRTVLKGFRITLISAMVAQ